MANWYCDSKDGLDGNGGTSWGDAVKTIAQLETLGSSGDSYYLMGRGSAYPYNCPASDLSATYRAWYGKLTSGSLGGPGRFEGFPQLIASGSRVYTGPASPYVVKDIYFKSFIKGVNFLRNGGGFPENVIERCIFDDCDQGVALHHEDNEIVRYCLFFDCFVGLRNTSDPTAGNDKEIHHNTFYGCTTGFTLYASPGDQATYDAWHSNIFVGNTTGAAFSSDGTVTFNTAGEPNHNVWYNNTTDLDDGGQGISKGANAINADPEFTDQANDDYRLAPGSPALYSDGSNKNRGGMGPGSKPEHRLRLGKFFAIPGKLIQADSIWRDYNLLET